MELDDLLREVIMRESSDLHLKVGRPPLMRINGQLLISGHPPVNAQEVERLLFGIMTESQVNRFKEEWEADFSYELQGEARFRVNAFYQQGKVGVAMRHIPLRVPTLDDLRLPPILKDLALRKQGLLLFTGPTGAGKTTSMAAMTEHINNSENKHIVTIEDPIEFVYTDRKCTINQREVGRDTRSHTEALKHVLRQDPDVILMGEMRDADTMEIGMHAAETGHLVFSTLHTNNAKQTVDRILDTFAGELVHQYRMMLSMTLLGVLSQRLVQRADQQGRVAAMEVMVNSPNIAQLIREGKTTDLHNAIAKSRSYWDMQTFNQALVQLVADGLITAEEAMANSETSGDLRLLLRGVGIGADAGAKEEETLTPGGLSRISGRPTRRT